MEITKEIGETAGEMWRTLSSGGPMTLSQLKKKLDGNAELINFAAGWLAREDKIELIPEKKNILVQLKQG